MGATKRLFYAHKFKWPTHKGHSKFPVFPNRGEKAPGPNGKLSPPCEKKGLWAPR